MKMLIKKIVLVLLPALTLVIAFELLARTIPTSYSAKHEALMKKKDKVEILVLGASHSNWGIDPQYFGSEAFNMANSSQCLYQDSQVLLRYLPECKNLRLVIVPISYFTLQSDLAASPEAWRCAYYSVYMGVRGDASSSFFDIRNHSALALWDGPIGVVKNLRRPPKSRVSQYGYQAPEAPKSKVGDLINDRAGMARVAFHDKTMNPDLLGSNIAVLDGMAETLKRSNIKMVLVTTPVYKTYSEHVTKKNYDLMTRTVTALAKRHSVQAFNYFYDGRFDIGDFLDNDHLNETGAKKFSLILKNEVVDRTR